MYTNYKMARDNAWKFLIRHKVKELPVDVFNLCQKDKLTLIPYSAPQANVMAATIGAADLMQRTDGFAVQIAKKVIIFWDDSLPLPRQRFTVAHELGHIYNGDVGPAPTLRNREPAASDDACETAANIFASRILAPACVLWALGVHDANTIARLCAISPVAAKFRCERLSLLYDRERAFLAKYGRSCFLSSPLERKVFSQFKKYINK